MRRLDHIILHVSAYPVLRPKERRQIDPALLMKKVCGVTQTVIHRGLIAD
jgi:hypothetical protein